MTEQTNKPTIMEFKCPACGKDDRLGKRLSDQVKKRGLMRENLNFFAWQFDGVVRDPGRDLMIPIGSSLPAFKVFMDVCLQCGCLYAAKIEIGVVVKGLAAKPTPPTPPFSTS